ncbi:MAG: MarR family winged helix-turn-helix transcriptional regulator [Candidatus Izemoplasmatales bacterium]|jgi:MarR family 2-MHQ and catechol resistance regulon transcriptional repressor|nr:MarR family winged helix-turn-helix transcriptional regulator [Candidatus Izemoplasmatales bacterium]
MNELKTITVLFRAYNSLEKAVRDDIAKYGLNTSEFGVLEALYHKEKLSVKGVIDKVLTPNSSMSYVIENLVNKGYIIKNQSEKDKRSFVLELTQMGRKMMDVIFPLHKQNIRDILNVLDKEEEIALQKALVKIGKSSLRK